MSALTPWIAAAMTVPSLMSLSLTAFNLLVWPRGRQTSAQVPSVSVLIPARNEERCIEATVRSVMQNADDLLECVVCDDGSTDATPQILAALAQEFPKLRVIQGIGLPAGWVGKPHACHRLSMQAAGEWLLFLDADTRLQKGGIRRAADVMSDYAADVLSVVPHQEMVTRAEQIVMPMLLATYTSWLPLPLIWRSQDPRFLAAMGQFLLVRRAAYTTLGGFESVKAEVVDDMAFCRNAKRSGLRMVFADGTHMARCRMYTGWQEIRDGFSKNLYEGIGGNMAGLLVVSGLYFAAFVLPWLLLMAGCLSWIPGIFTLAGAVGVAASLAMRVLLGLRMGFPLWSVLFHPLATLAFLSIAWRSWSWSRRGAIVWSGRVYAARAQRTGAA